MLHNTSQYFFSVFRICTFDVTKNRQLVNYKESVEYICNKFVSGTISRSKAMYIARQMDSETQELITSLERERQDKELYTQANSQIFSLTTSKLQYDESNRLLKACNKEKDIQIKNLECRLLREGCFCDISDKKVLEKNIRLAQLEESNLLLKEKSEIKALRNELSHEKMVRKTMEKCNIAHVENDTDNKSVIRDLRQRINLSTEKSIRGNENLIRVLRHKLTNIFKVSMLWCNPDTEGTPEIHEDTKRSADCMVRTKKYGLFFAFVKLNKGNPKWYLQKGIKLEYKVIEYCLIK